MPIERLAEKRIAAITVRHNAFVPSANNWDDFLIISRIEENSWDELRLSDDCYIRIIN
jgi:hypothetical protein